MKIQKSKSVINFEVQILVEGPKKYSTTLTVNEYNKYVPSIVECYTGENIFKTLKLNKLDIEKVKEFIINVFNFNKTEDDCQIENIEFDVSNDEIAKAIEENGEYSEIINDVNVIVPLEDQCHMYNNFLYVNGYCDMSIAKVKAIKIIKK